MINADFLDFNLLQYKALEKRSAISNKVDKSKYRSVTRERRYGKVDLAEPPSPKSPYDESKKESPEPRSRSNAFRDVIKVEDSNKLSKEKIEEQKIIDLIDKQSEESSSEYNLIKPQLMEKSSRHDKDSMLSSIRAASSDNNESSKEDLIDQTSPPVNNKFRNYRERLKKYYENLRGTTYDRPSRYRNIDPNPLILQKNDQFSINKVQAEENIDEEEEQDSKDLNVSSLIMRENDIDNYQSRRPYQYR